MEHLGEERVQCMLWSREGRQGGIGSFSLSRIRSPSLLTKAVPQFPPSSHHQRHSRDGAEDWWARYQENRRGWKGGCNGWIFAEIQAMRLGEMQPAFETVSRQEDFQCQCPSPRWGSKEALGGSAGRQGKRRETQRRSDGNDVGPGGRMRGKRGK